MHLLPQNSKIKPCLGMQGPVATVSEPLHGFAYELSSLLMHSKSSCLAGTCAGTPAGTLAQLLESGEY